MIKITEWNYSDYPSNTVIYKDNEIVYKTQNIAYDEFIDIFKAIGVKCEYEYYYEDELMDRGSIW